MSYDKKNHITELKREFESENFTFKLDNLSQGIRLKIPTKNISYPYINVLDSYNDSTKTAHICLTKTVLDILKKRDYTLYNTLNHYLTESKKHQLTNQDLIPIHKIFYSFSLIRQIIKVLKEDYLDSGSKVNISPVIDRKKENQLSFIRTASKEQKQYNLKKGYNENWWPYVQDKAREKSDYSCDYCGVSVKESKDYTCEITGVTFSREKLLHVHHKDRNKKNDNPDNLASLCVTCHSSQQGLGHQHMRFDNGFKSKSRFGIDYNHFVHHHRILNQLRIKQNIDPCYNLNLNNLKIGFHENQLITQIVYRDRPIEKIVYRERPIEKIVYRDRPIEKIVYEDKIIEKIVYKDRPVEKIVYEDKIIEKIVYKEKSLPINQKFLLTLCCSSVFLLLISFLLV